MVATSANSVPIFHGDVVFILHPEIPKVTQPFIDDVPIKGPATRYIQSNGEPETIPENPGIRRFVWEHFQDVRLVVTILMIKSRQLPGKPLCIMPRGFIRHLILLPGYFIMIFHCDFQNFAWDLSLRF